MSEEGIEKVRISVQDYAEKKGYTLNVDEKQLEAVLRGIARNTERFGEAYCPCRIRSGDPEKDRNIICPCVYHEREIEEQGICHCRLFVKKEAE